MKNEKLLVPAMHDKVGKYHELVWFARKPPEDDPWWLTCPPDIRKGAFQSMIQVEERFPEEVSRLRSESGDWEHGFNSGVLAALRWVCSVSTNGLDHAEEMWPELDT